MTLRLHPDQIVAESASPLLSVAPWWERVRLGDVAAVINGAAFKSSLFNNEGRGEPLVRIRDVGRDQAQVHYDGPYEQRHVIEHGDLLIGMDGDFRVARWGGGRALLNQRVCRIAVKDPALYDQRLLLHILQPYLDAVHAVTSSVTVKHLSSRTIHDLPIPLPPRAEQERIVAAIEEHLTRLDAAGAVLEHLPRRMGQFRQVLLREAFASGWERIPMAKVTDPERVIRYGILKPGPDVSGGVPVVKVRDYPNGVIRTESLKRTSPEIADRYRGATLRRGDLLISIRGTYGRVASVPDELDGANITQDSARIAPAPVIHRPFLIHFLRSPECQAHLRQVARGVAVKGVNIRDLRQLPIPLPDLDAQVRAAAVLDEQLALHAHTIGEVERTRVAARALRRSLLAAASSGQLVPQDPGDEPASVLLERIRAEPSAAGPVKPSRKVKAS